MKKIISMLMAGAMMVSTIPVAYAAGEHGNYESGTVVSYNAEDPDGDGVLDNKEAYTVTVPATLKPVQEGDVNKGQVALAGTWNSTRIVKVSAPETVILKNSINPDNTKTLNISFEDIELQGSNTVALSQTNDISVSEISDALFGTWSGTIEYIVSIEDVG